MCIFSVHCKTFAPEYVKTAKKLGENTPPYYIAKLDATDDKEVAERFGVKKFPTIFFFR